MSTTVREWNQAVFEQFPFLPKLRVTERISVEKLDKDFLDLVPEESEGTNASGWSCQDKIEMWSAEGVNLGKVRAGFFSRETGSSDQGETVGDRVARILDQGHQIAFITRFQWDSGAEHTGSSESSSLSIHRVKDFDLRAWSEARKEAARAALAAELGA